MTGETRVSVQEEAFILFAYVVNRTSGTISAIILIKIQARSLNQALMLMLEKR